MRGNQDMCGWKFYHPITGEITSRCDSDTVAIITGSCVHEHLDSQVPTCRYHLDFVMQHPELMTCWTCFQIDGHHCPFHYVTDARPAVPSRGQ